MAELSGFVVMTFFLSILVFALGVAANSIAIAWFERLPDKTDSAVKQNRIFLIVNLVANIVMILMTIGAAVYMMRS